MSEKFYNPQWRFWQSPTTILKSIWYFWLSQTTILQSLRLILTTPDNNFDNPKWQFWHFWIKILIIAVFNFDNPKLQFWQLSTTILTIPNNFHNFENPSKLFWPFLLKFVKRTSTRLKRLSVFKAAHRLTVFAQFHRNLKLLQHFCKTLEGSARYCKILHVVPDLLRVILTLNSSNTSLA